MHRDPDKPYNFVCACDCGGISSLPGSEIKKKTKCKFCNAEDNGKPLGKGYEEIIGSKWSAIIYSAKIRNLEFLIDAEYAWHLFLKQDRKCALSGVELFFSKSSRIACSASLDRIDSTKGYIAGNVQWVHKDINNIKQDYTDEEFIDFCSRVHFYKNHYINPDNLLLIENNRLNVENCKLKEEKNQKHAARFYNEEFIENSKKEILFLNEENKNLKLRVEELEKQFWKQIQASKPTPSNS